MAHMLSWAGVLLLVVAAGDSFAAETYRLPQQAVPTGYDLSLVPYFDTFTFDGRVMINVTAKQTIHNITLHAADLEIKSVTVTNMKILTTTVDNVREFLILHFTEAIKSGAEYTISIDYIGNIRGELDGFYRSSYKTLSGETRWLATTQFEATAARFAFPCFDEPALKATFDIRIAPPSGYHAIANTALQNIYGPDSSIGNRTWFRFERSAPMSTYLVAFIVSDFCYLQDGNQRIFGTCDEIHKGQYALSVSGPILDVLAQLTNHPYQLSKMDQAAIPDFSAGAMENWGLVTYRSGYLLLNGDEYYYKKDSATVIAHEFAHQWFGNQVSPDWWTYLWLSEAFATYFEYFAAAQVETEWPLAEEFVFDIQYYIMYYDSFASYAHEISYYVETPEEIDNAFDMITYYKGGCLIKHAKNFLTEATFYKGLNIYQSERAYAAAVPDDLFSAWQKAADQDGVLSGGPSVADILNSWTLQAGYPLLTVVRDYEAGTATVTQKLFLRSGSSNDDPKWYVPISYTTESEQDFETTKPKLWLTPKEDSITIRGLRADDWLLINIQWGYYYRVNYDEQNWNRLLVASNADVFPDVITTQLEDDLGEIRGAGLLPPGVAYGALRPLSRLSPAVASRVLFRSLLPADRASAPLAACGGAAPRVCELALRGLRTNLRHMADIIGGPKEILKLLHRMAFYLSSEGQVAMLRSALEAAQKEWPNSIHSEDVQQVLATAQDALTSLTEKQY